MITIDDIIEEYNILEYFYLQSFSNIVLAYNVCEESITLQFIIISGNYLMFYFLMLPDNDKEILENEDINISSA